MQTKVEKLKQGKVKIVITIEPKELVKYFNHSYEELAPSVKLDGFRPGKAPRTLIESSIGVTRILSDALDHAVSETYQEALFTEKITPVTPPTIKINKYPTYGATEEEVKNPLEYEAELTVLPEVKLGDYSKIKIEKPKTESVSDSDLEKILENLRRQKATFDPIDRTAKMGDLADLSYEGSIKGVKIEAMASKNHPVVLGEKTLIPGFEEEVVGMKKYDKKTFKIKFPKDYHAKEYAGKEAEFAVEVNDLKEVKLPEVDDSFAADFGHKTAADLKKAITENLQQEYSQKAQNDLEQAILDKMLPLVKVEVPDAMIESEIDRMIHDYEHRLQHSGLNFQAYLDSTKKTVEGLRKEMRESAIKNIKVGLMLGKIIEQEKIDHKNPDAGKLAIEHLVKTLTK